MGIRPTGRLTIPGLRARLAVLQGPRMRVRLSQVLAAAAGKLVNDGFLESRDPYGKAWAPLKYRKGQPLLDTGRLRASFAARPVSGGFRIDATASYAGVHQYGATIKPHSRRGGAIPVNKRGRFVSKRKAAGAKGRAQRVAIFGGYTHGGGTIPRRQMLPMESTGGLPGVWVAVFNRETAALIERAARGESL